MNSMFRLLKAEEIECRVKQCTEKGAMVLLYKDARCDMNILDEAVGPMYWQCEYSRDNANCTVKIWDTAKEQWISKEDTGTESNTEAEKGLASDSFKRACFKWGIGRELYTAPFIWIKASDCKKLKESNGKWQCFDKFKVRSIGYDDGGISYLVIENEKHEVVFTYGAMHMTARKKLLQYCDENGLDTYEVAEKYGINKENSEEEIEKVLEDLKNERK